MPISAKPEISAHFVSFNFTNSLICAGASRIDRGFFFAGHVGTKAASAAALLEPGPRVAGDPIPGFSDRLELTDLLDGAVLPFGLDIPMTRVRCLDLARLEDRTG
jgi:hypothetical protein